MTFVVSHTTHFNGKSGVAVVTTDDFNVLAEYGWVVGKTYRKARFHHNQGQWWKLEDMGVGMILKGERGEYIHRVA